MDAARMGAERPVHVEEAVHLRQDVVEPPRLVPAGSLEGVAVHRIADPGDRHPGPGGRRRSRTRAAPIRLMNVSRPGSPEGLSASASARTSAGVAEGPSLTPTGLQIS